jgi:catechol 2,3-dioxygenase-like lactoylglutathione lyase family enzyme
MARITGIGGVFFKSKGDGAALAAWYREHLGMPLEDFGGAILRWPADEAEDRGLTVWHVASADSRWFSPSESSFMVNYRVDNLGELLDELRAGGVEVVQGPESH